MPPGAWARAYFADTRRPIPHLRLQVGANVGTGVHRLACHPGEIHFPVTNAGGGYAVVASNAQTFSVSIVLSGTPALRHSGAVPLGRHRHKVHRRRRSGTNPDLRGPVGGRDRKRRAGP
jgi:hypothetical protein